MAVLAAHLGSHRVVLEKVYYAQPTPRLKLVLVYFRSAPSQPVPPLFALRFAGPVLRAAFCHLHYVGRYAVMAARSWAKPGV